MDEGKLISLNFFVVVAVNQGVLRGARTGPKLSHVGPPPVAADFHARRG
jgi:hypothetical protein